MLRKYVSNRSLSRMFSLMTYSISHTNHSRWSVSAWLVEKNPYLSMLTIRTFPYYSACWENVDRISMTTAILMNTSANNKTDDSCLIRDAFTELLTPFHYTFLIFLSRLSMDESQNYWRLYSA